MIKWNSAKMITVLSRLLGPVLDHIDNQGPGGDYDTDQLIVFLKGTENKMFLSGFVTDPEFQRDNSGLMEVEFIELTDQSGDGYQYHDAISYKAYCEIKGLLMKHGAHVVDTHKDYF